MKPLIGENGMPVEVSLVADSAGDVRLMQEASREANITVQMHIVPDGVAAMEFLREGLVKCIDDSWLSGDKLPQHRQST